MVTPEKPGDFEPFDCSGLTVYMQRSLLEENDDSIEFLIPKHGMFEIQIQRSVPSAESES